MSYDFECASCKRSSKDFPGGMLSNRDVPRFAQEHGRLTMDNVLICEDCLDAVDDRIESAVSALEDLFL